MIDQIRSLAIFAVVAESGSFRDAANTLGLSPSVVSHQIGALEARLGVALIYRTTRSFSLTPDGVKLLPSAQAVMYSAQEGFSGFTDISSEPVGTLRISAPAVFAPGPFLDDIKEFGDAYPGVSVNISFSDAETDVIRGGFDLAIRVGWPPEGALKTKKLGEFSQLLVASPNYAATKKAPRAPRDLEGWRVIGFTPRAEPIELIHPKHDAASFRGATQISVDSAIAVHRLALAGGGLAALPDFIVWADLEQGRLVQALPTWRLPSSGIHAIWPPNAPRKGLVERLATFLTAKVAEKRARHLAQ